MLVEDQYNVGDVVTIAGLTGTVESMSLRKTTEFQKREDAVTLLDSRQFNRVSRIHCEIEFRKDGQVQIRDLSRNGTFVDGVRVGRSHLLRVGKAHVTVELVDGTWGKLLLVEETPAD